NVKPVMRHFFTEKHKTPNSWFATRLDYSRSVATSSIVGHILGLGDRHISNILIDNVTGEVIPIDLGIAFDQGKLLGVPELVPFRLTRDMVDGMGTSGTAGVFQRCAEETLRVLRDGSEVIMTVLEVFKHDPLHSWTASETRIQRVQEGATTSTTTTTTTTTTAVRYGVDIGIDMSSGSAEEAADRALSSVSRKLDKSLSVQTVVSQLVREATDPVNLALMFEGWSAYY
ncbi:Serine/threonine-protein kinase TEL1, partial [Termitomyces sp. T112]